MDKIGGDVYTEDWQNITLQLKWIGIIYKNGQGYVHGKDSTTVLGKNKTLLETWK